MAAEQEVLPMAKVTDLTAQLEAANAALAEAAEENAALIIRRHLFLSTALPSFFAAVIPVRQPRPLFFTT